MDILKKTTSAVELERYCGECLDGCRKLVRDVLDLSDPRTRKNSLEPLNELYLRLGNAWNVVALLRSVHPDEGVRHAAEQSEQEIARFWNDLGLDRGLYEVYRSFDRSTLDEEGVRMVDHTLRDFRRAGVDRDDATRERVRELRQELVTIGQDFLRNILSDVRDVVLDGREELSGLPEDYVRDHVAGTGESSSDGKIRITTDYPDYNPFMTYSHNAARREQLYVEFRKRAYPENLEKLDRLLRQRHELATLLGYPNWAAYATEDKMIQTAEAVAAFIGKVSLIARPRAEREYQMLLEEKRKDQPHAERVADWEKAYYEERVRLTQFRVDSKRIREYFEYTNVRTGVLDLIAELFDIGFESDPSAARWHPDVEVLRVVEDGRLVGRIYLDMHPRDGKFKHAAMFPLLRGVRGSGLPEAVLVCNFPNPNKNGGPALLEHEDVITLLHEFGHLLHHLFARDSEWVRFNGTATEWDFVEVPSQLFEEWAWEYDVLRRFAIHPETGEPIPRELVEEMRTARDFGRSLLVSHQMFYAALSLRCHHGDPADLDTSRLVQETQNRYSLFRFVEGTYFQASFGHLDDYSALYYTYMWSLVIEKDLFGRFEEAGLMNPSMARKYRESVLAPGGSKDAKDLVRAFLGRDDSFEAFEAWLSGESRCRL